MEEVHPRPAAALDPLLPHGVDYRGHRGEPGPAGNHEQVPRTLEGELVPYGGADAYRVAHFGPADGGGAEKAAGDQLDVQFDCAVGAGALAGLR